MKVISGILFIAVGAWLIAVGIANSSDGAPPFSVPGGSLLIDFIPSALSDIGGYGPLVTLGVVGLLVGLSGLRFIIESGDKEEFEEEEEEEAHLGGLTIGELINMSQGILTKEQAEKILKNLRPNLLSYQQHIEENALIVMARNVLQLAVMDHQRKAKKNVTADQYHIQGQRMMELEKKPFARRYMPLAKAPSEKAQQTIGKLFDLSTQSSLEQEFASDTSDWQDVSLNNLQTVMAQPHKSESA